MSDQYVMERRRTKEMIVGEQSDQVLHKTEEEQKEEENALAEKDHSRKDSKRKMDESEDESVEEELKRRKKPRVVWTPALHVEFMDAIHQLGYDKAVPSTILEVMNRPELTRRNVASHLQKLRQHFRQMNKDEVQNYHLDPLHLGLSSSGSLSAHKPMTPLNLFPQHPENTRYMNLLQQNRIPSTPIQQANANPTTAFFPLYWNTGSPSLANRFTNQPSPYFDFSSMGGNTTTFFPHHGNTGSPFLANKFTNQPSPYSNSSSMGGNIGTPQFLNLLSTVRASNPTINPNNIAKQNVGDGLRLPPTPRFGMSNLGVGSNGMGSSGDGIGHLSNFHPQNHGRHGGVREDASSSTSQAAKIPNWFRFTK